jgi:hypothetical protein
MANIKLLENIEASAVFVYNCRNLVIGFGGVFLVYFLDGRFAGGLGCAAHSTGKICCGGKVAMSLFLVVWNCGFKIENGDET